MFKGNLHGKPDAMHGRESVWGLFAVDEAGEGGCGGFLPYAGLFCISIQTRKTDSGAEIVVADNGRGFNPDNGGEPHIALKNIQQRLALICGGSLTIKPNDGGGTVVTVTIPDSTVE